MANTKMSVPPIGNREFLKTLNVFFILFIKKLIKNAIITINEASLGMKYRSFNKLKSEQTERTQNKSGDENHRRLVAIRMVVAGGMAVGLLDLVLTMQRTIITGTIKLSKSIESL
jgi:hypothetical protein